MDGPLRLARLGPDLASRMTMERVVASSLLAVLCGGVALIACGDDGPTQTVQRSCGSSSKPSTAIQLGSAVDLDTCEPDFSARTLVANVGYAVDAIDAPVTFDLSGTPDGQVEVCTGGTCNPAESASLELERFVVGDGASGALTVVVDGTESTTDFDAVWCEREGGTPPCD